MTLYMFRTVFPSIIRSSRLYIEQQVFVKQILLSACSNLVHKIIISEGLFGSFFRIELSPYLESLQTVLFRACNNGHFKVSSILPSIQHDFILFNLFNIYFTSCLTVFNFIPISSCPFLAPHFGCLFFAYFYLLSKFLFCLN